ncbi:MAG: hypothetical protein KIS92_25030 [Planctomycetota bacterium]|nr:hypothetical protein [Planctomycetota bacterium]
MTKVPPPSKAATKKNDSSSELPKAVTDWLRSVFATCNRRITDKLCNNPNAPEPSFDLTWIDELSQYATPVLINDSWVARIDAHYLGGLRHFMEWEIADIGLLLFVRRKGSVVTRKVALLQSKRLYPTNNLVRVEDRFDFEIGIARLADPEDLAHSIAATREFEFTNGCEYGALSSESEQVKAIEEYQKQNGVPVHYQFYNPINVPFTMRIPATSRQRSTSGPALGVRIMRAADVHFTLSGMPKGSHPTLEQLKQIGGYGGETGGWSLEDFVVDLFLSCREGTHFQSVNSPKIQNLFYRRSGPISAAIAITIEELSIDSQAPKAAKNKKKRK